MWNTASAVRACRAGLTGFALLILSASLAEAQFGQRTTIGANYQQTSRVQSVNGRDPESCSSTFCRVLFQRTPQKKPLIVQHVSCNVRFVNSQFQLYNVELWSRKGTDVLLRRTYLLPVAMSAGVWVVNSPVMHLVKSGEVAVLNFQGTNGNTAWDLRACSISGKLQKP